jgi:hypothetical protein
MRAHAMPTASKADTLGGWVSCLYTAFPPPHHTPHSLKCWSKDDHRSKRCATKAKQKQAQGSRTTPLRIHQLHSLATTQQQVSLSHTYHPQQLEADNRNKQQHQIPCALSIAWVRPNPGHFSPTNTGPSRTTPRLQHRQAARLARKVQAVWLPTRTFQNPNQIYMYLSSPQSRRTAITQKHRRKKLQNHACGMKMLIQAGAPATLMQRQPTHLKAPPSTQHHLRKHTSAQAVVCHATATAHIMRQTAHRQRHWKAEVWIR